MNKRLITLSVIVGLAALSRLLPHPPNVTPIAAMALFAGAHFRNRKAAFLLPIAAMFLSDLVLGFAVYGSALLKSQPVVYFCMLTAVAIGRLIRTKSDQGIVVVLDNRILTKRYGQAFLAGMPKCPVEVV